MKGIISLLTCVTVLFANDANVNAAVSKIQVIETNKSKPYCGILSYYTTSLKLPTGFLSTDQIWSMHAKFDSAKRIMLAKITSAVKWDGAKSNASSFRLQYSEQVEVSGTTSTTVSQKIGVSVPVYAAEVSAEIGGDVTCSVTYSSSEMKSYEYTLDRTSKAGYYGIIVVVNADLYNITLERGTKQKTGKLLKFESKEPYINLYCSDKSF